MKTILISLGGSIVVPKSIDTDFIGRFRKLVIKDKQRRYVIMVGGGKLCREYVAAARELGVKDEKDLDWIGIMSSRANAEVLRAAFGKEAYKKVLVDPTSAVETEKRIIIGAAYKPGWSTDNVAMLYAETNGIKEILNLSNIKAVYDKDPSEYQDAAPKKELSWDELIDIVGTRWTPGMNVPFDPIAAKKGKDLGVKVAVMDGRDLKNIENYLAEEEFDGTIIS